MASRYLALVRFPKEGERILGFAISGPVLLGKLVDPVTAFESLDKPIELRTIVPGWKVDLCFSPEGVPIVSEALSVYLAERHSSPYNFVFPAMDDSGGSLGVLATTRAYLSTSSSLAGDADPPFVNSHRGHGSLYIRYDVASDIARLGFSGCRVREIDEIDTDMWAHIGGRPGLEAVEEWRSRQRHGDQPEEGST